LAVKCNILATHQYIKLSLDGRERERERDFVSVRIENSSRRQNAKDINLSFEL